MNIFTFFEKLGERIVYYIALFIYSGAFPYFFWTLVGLILFLILRRIYLALRDKNLGNITYSRAFSEEGVFEGDEVELIETISNRGFFPLLRVDIEAFLYNELRLTGYEPPRRDGMQYFISRFNLWPYMRIRRRHKVVCLARGFYALQTSSVMRRRDELFFDCPAQIYVYPRPVPLTTVALAAGRIQGEERAARQLFADPFSISGVRDYRFGDPVTQVNFKVSARTWMTSGASSSPLKVNDRDFCATRRIAVYMDFHLERDCGIDGIAYALRAEAGLSYASAMIREATYSGFTSAFYTNCRGSDGSMALRFPPASGEAHMLDIFRAMAQLRPADGASFPSLLDEAAERGDTDCEIVLILYCASPETDMRINLLRRMGNSVQVLMLTEDDEHEATERERRLDSIAAAGSPGSAQSVTEVTQ